MKPGRGCALALADNNAHNVATVAAEAKKAGAGTISTHAVDVADLTGMTRFRDEVKQAHGRVQLLISNAGVALNGELEEVSVDDMRWLVDINFWGTVYGTRLFLTRRRGRGSSSPSSRRRRAARGRGSVLRWCTASSRTMAAASK